MSESNKEKNTNMMLTEIRKNFGNLDDDMLHLQDVEAEVGSDDEFA